MKKYYQDDFDTDMEWLCGHGITTTEAEEFILHLLDSEWKVKK